MSETFTCPWHQVELDVGGDGCSQCYERYASLPDPSILSPAERAKELLEISSAPLTVKFPTLWERIDALVGRSTLTHELAAPESLAAEILSGEHPTDVEVVMKLKGMVGDKPVHVIPAEGEAYTL